MATMAETVKTPASEVVWPFRVLTKPPSPDPTVERLVVEEALQRLVQRFPDLVCRQSARQLFGRAERNYWQRANSFLFGLREPTTLQHLHWSVSTNIPPAGAEQQHAAVVADRMELTLLLAAVVHQDKLHLISNIATLQPKELMLSSVLLVSGDATTANAPESATAAAASTAVPSAFVRPVSPLFLYRFDSAEHANNSPPVGTPRSSDP